MAFVQKHLAKIVLIVFMIVQGGFGLYAAASQKGVDFAAYYLAAQALQRGENIYTLTDWQDLAAEFNVPAVEPPYRYPPLTVGVIGLFAGLPFKIALMVWNSLSIIALAISGFALSKLLADRWIDPITFAALTFYGPTLATSYAGQANNFVLAGVALYLLWLKRQKIFPAGLALAFGIMFKPLPAPLIIHLAWRREFKKALMSIMGLIVIAAASIVLTGPQVGVDYVNNALQLSTLSVDASPGLYPPNQSVFGFFGRLFITNEYGGSIMNDPSIARWLALGVTSLLVLGIAVLTWPRKNSIDSFALQAGLILATINLIVPVSWYHHAVLSFAAIASAWYASRSRNMHIGLIIAFILIDAQGVLWHSFVGQTWLLSLGTYGLIIIYYVTAVSLLKNYRPTINQELIDG